MTKRQSLATQHDLLYMDLALENAETSLKNGWMPVGAIFVHRDRIIASGTKNGMVHARFDHAEHNGCYQALWSRKGPRDLDGVTVYSTLEPCILCMAMLLTTRVSRIVYGLEDPYGGGSYLLSSPKRPARFRKELPELSGGVRRDESMILMHRFFAAQKENSKAWPADNPLVMLCR